MAAGTEFALTKKAADDYLRTLDLNWILLRPSLVYAQGSYGGTSALRGVAGMPGFTPLIGDGGQTFQPIYVADLAETVSRCLASPQLNRQTLDVVGPDILTLREILTALRAWLDLPAASSVEVPVPLVRLAARFGDWLGAGPLRSTAIDQLLYNNVSDADAFAAAIGFRPRSMASMLLAMPSHVQDRWHARLYGLCPLLTAALAAIWTGSGVASLVSLKATAQIAAALHVPASLAGVAAIVFAVIDILIGMAVIIRPSRRLEILQLILISGYTAVFTILLPWLWVDPLGPILKNLSVIIAAGIWTAVLDDK